MKKVAIYIDAEALYSDTIATLDCNIKMLIDLLKNESGLLLLTNSILRLEIEDKISRIEIPNNLNRCFDRDQIHDIEKVFKKNKQKCQNTLDELFVLGTDLKIDISHEEVIEGCIRQYKKEAPWGKKKNNEWKDFFVQKSLIKFFIEKSKKEDCEELVILSKDKGFEHMKEEGIDVRSTSLKEFAEYIPRYLVGKADFKDYLINKIYEDLEFQIIDEINRAICEEEVFYNVDIFIDSIEIESCLDKKDVVCRIVATVFDVDEDLDAGYLENYIIGRAKEWVDKTIECEAHFSFEEGFNFDKIKTSEEYNGKYTEPKVYDDNIIKLTEVCKIGRVN